MNLFSQIGHVWENERGGGGEEEEGRRDAFILGLLEMNLRYGVRSVVNC